MVIMPNAPDALLDLGTLLSETRVLLSGRFERLPDLLQAHGCLGRPSRAALVGLVSRAYRMGLQPIELLLGFDHGLVCCPFFGGHGPRNGFDQFMLHMKQVG